MTSNELRYFAFALVAMAGCATDPTETESTVPTIVLSVDFFFPC